MGMERIILSGLAKCTKCVGHTRPPFIAPKLPEVINLNELKLCPNFKSELGDVVNFSKTTQTKKQVIDVADKIKIESEKFATDLYRRFETRDMNIMYDGKQTCFTVYKGSKAGVQTAGFWAKDKQGVLYYVKYAQDDISRAKLQSELISQRLYELAGINTVTSKSVKLEDGTAAIMSEYLGDFKTIYRPDEAGEIYRGFGPDVWLANTDTFVGFVESPNTTIHNGKLLKIDTGDCLEFSSKRFKFDDKVTAIQDFVNPERTCFISRMYDEIPRNEVIKSFETVCKITDKQIREICCNEQLAQKLINRRNYMQQFLDKMKCTPQEEQWILDYFNKIAAQI